MVSKTAVRTTKRIPVWKGWRRSWPRWSAQDALTRRRQRLAYLCRDAHPVLIVCFHVLGWDLEKVIEWTNRLQFDDNTKNVAHLLIEDRGEEINERLRQLTHENPVKWHPLD